MGKMCFAADILSFLIFGENRWSDIVVPAIFEISIPKTPPPGQSFMLLSRSAQLHHKMLHIRPTTGDDEPTLRERHCGIFNVHQQLVLADAAPFR